MRFHLAKSCISVLKPPPLLCFVVRLKESQFLNITMNADHKKFKPTLTNNGSIKQTLIFEIKYFYVKIIMDLA